MRNAKYAMELPFCGVGIFGSKSQLSLTPAIDELLLFHFYHLVIYHRRINAYEYILEI